MTQNVLPPFPVFIGSDGLAIDGAKIYIGNPNADPLLSPKSVFYDVALSVAAAQPLRTSGGLIYRNGTPTPVYVNGDYSILVRDENNQLIYSAASAQVRITTTGDVVIPAGTSLSVEVGGAVDLADGSALNLGDATGAGVAVNVASTTRILGNLSPDVNGRDLGNSGQRWDLFASTIDAGKTSTSYADQPAAEADFAATNRRTLTLAACRQTSVTATPATTNIYNVPSITHIATGVYDVNLTVPVDDIANVVPHATSGQNGVIATISWSNSTVNKIRLSFFDPVTVANINTDFTFTLTGYIPV